MKKIIIEGVEYREFFEKYYVSCDGDVYSSKSNIHMKHDIDKDGYHRITIGRKHFKIHRIVYQVWVGIIPEGKQVNHKDDDKDNNFYLNLYAGTQKENIKDCIKNKHRRGNIHELIIKDKQTGEIKKFNSCSEFLQYCGHPQRNRSLAHCYNKKWFTERYEVIQKGVTTKRVYKNNK